MNPFSLLRPSFCSLALVCSLLLLLRLLLPLQATGCGSRISSVFQLVARCVADARDASSFLSSCERFSPLFAIYATVASSYRPSQDSVSRFLRTFSPLVRVFRSGSTGSIVRVAFRVDANVYDSVSPPFDLPSLRSIALSCRMKHVGWSDS